MPYEVILTNPAQKNLDKLPKKVQTRIANALESLGEEPRGENTRKLEGQHDLWRIRVGKYRVVYTIEDVQLLVLVVRVAHRKDAYRGL